MKLTPKQVGWGMLCGVAALNLGSGFYFAKRDEKQIQNNKSEVLKKAPDKYNQLMEKSRSGRVVDWRQAVSEMRDSLRTDSIYKKGFKAGYQRAVDSINTMQAKEVYKTVGKAIK